MKLQSSIKSLPMRKRCEIVNAITKKRLQTLVPMIMRESGIDMWIILCREDNLDPVFSSMIPVDTWWPILQILVFYDRGDGGVEGINISRTDTSDFFSRPYEVRLPDQQWGWLAEVVAARDPKRIGINQARDVWAADGLTVTLKAQLIEAIGAKYAARLEPAEEVCRRWFELLIPEEMEIYQHVVSLLRSVEREVFSPQYVVPGATTIDDLKWACWQRLSEMGVDLAVPRPHYRIARSKESVGIHGENDRVIRHGDLIHWDVAIEYMRLVADNHEWGYVPRPGENDVPAGIDRLFKQGLQLQDIYLGEFRQGRTGNEVLKSTLAKARQADLDTPRVFSHSIGHLLHEPGTLIGHGFAQDGWPVRGDYPISYNTSFVTEISVDGDIPEWDSTRIRMQQEGQITFTMEGPRYIAGRQEAVYVL